MNCEGELFQLDTGWHWHCPKSTEIFCVGKNHEKFEKCPYCGNLVVKKIVLVHTRIIRQFKLPGMPWEAIATKADLRRLLTLSEFAETCCDAPEDRMYHAKDGTWWTCVEENGAIQWVAADPPPGWKKDEKPPA
jgi:hypothetical protein